ncbi:MAG: LytTR family DNA-binding domain-containing protein [Clostridiales bacterium]|nr:LytTR family DNA-binding domain-containing protein [Clostridiales bacterium]
MKTILILEDNQSSLDMLVKIVGELDLDTEVRSATNLEQAHVHLIKGSIDLFLIDIILDPHYSGDVSGIKFAEYIRQQKKYEYTPVIFVTSLDDPMLYSSRDFHCYSYIEKPYDAEYVKKIVREALLMPLRPERSGSIYFRKNGLLYKKEKARIVYIENSRRGRIIHATDGEVKLAYLPCKDILQELDSEHFIQCSRYIIINKDYIEHIDIANRYIKLKGYSQPVEIGVMYKRFFMRNVVNG